MGGGVMVSEPMGNPARRYCHVVLVLWTEFTQRVALLGMRQPDIHPHE